MGWGFPDLGILACTYRYCIPHIVVVGFVDRLEINFKKKFLIT